MYYTRVIVISDLHLGGDPPYMMSHPQHLAAFIHTLPLRLAFDERLELIIAGDFIDFLAIPPPLQRLDTMCTVVTGSPF